MGKHFSDSLLFVCHVMSSDDDQPIVMDIYAGITSRNELAVAVDYYDYEDPQYNCSTAAIVDTHDARRMAGRHKIAYHELPWLIAESMEEWRKIINPTLSQVRNCFSEITECLLDEECRFKIIRTYGEGGYICC